MARSKIHHQLSADREAQQKRFDALTPIEAVIQLDSYRRARAEGQAIYHEFALAIGHQQLQQALRA